MQGQLQGIAVVHQHGIKISRGHDDFMDAGISKELQLAAQNRLGRGELRHALGMLGCKDAHAVAQARIENQCFHAV